MEFPVVQAKQMQHGGQPVIVLHNVFHGLMRELINCGSFYGDPEILARQAVDPVLRNFCGDRPAGSMPARGNARISTACTASE